MRYSTTSGLVLAAFSIGEAVAGPAHAHAHLHKKAIDKKDVDWAALDWNDMGIDWSSAWAAGQHSSTAAAVVAASTEAAAVVATTTAAAAVVATTSAASVAAATSATSLSGVASSVESTLVNDLELLWEGLVGASNYRTSFGTSTAASGSTGDNYYGNVGSPYAANVIRTSSTSDSDYTVTFQNTASAGMTINVWQKVGPDGQALSGSALAPKNTSLTFYLAAGSSQIIAIQDNTQIAWAEAVSDFAESGAYATTWGEANFVSTGSGYDVTAIMNPKNNNYDMTITSDEAPDCTSSRTENMWLTATDPVGTSDGSCYIAQTTAHLTVAMGGTI